MKNNGQSGARSGDHTHASVRRSDVQAWVTDRTTALKPSTLGTVYTILANIFRTAVQDGLLAKTPCERIELPRETRAEAVPFGPSAVNALAEAVGERNRALILTAATTGMRQAELFGLTRDRIDFMRRTVKVDRQLVAVDKDGAPLFGPPKTDASVRTIPLPQVALDAISAHIASYGVAADGLLFTTGSGTPWRRNNFHRQVWTPALKTVQLPPKATFHGLRHTYASLLIHAGESPRAIQGWLGHKSITETFDTYGHMWPSDHESTRAAIDAAFDPHRVDESLTQTASEEAS